MIHSIARLAIFAALLAIPSAAAAVDPIYQSGLFSPVAVSGADVVSYFTENRYVELPNRSRQFATSSSPRRRPQALARRH